MIQDVLRICFQEPSLVLKTDRAWSADQESNRGQIRTALSSLVGEDLADLKKLPDTARFSVSVSHCPGLGGFVVVAKSGDKPVVVGFDIESADRVNEKTAARVSLPEEVSAMPSPAHLWSAKESVFKSLRGNSQPSALSQINIHEWQTYRHEKLEPRIGDFFVFRASLGKGANLPGKGVVFQEDTFVISIFCHSTST
jgi:hypothetical protein